MCGRYTSTSTVEDLAAVFQVDEIRAEPLPLRYNVAPTQPVYAVAMTPPKTEEPDKGPRRALGTFRWGLVPTWAKDVSVGNRMINARAEGITSKPTYRNAVSRRRRCLIPADAFYEWQRCTDGDGKPAGTQPYALRRRDGRPTALAGIWESWRDRAHPDAEPVRSCAIVTTRANSVMAPIHDRMPVVLEPDGWAAWLDSATDLDVIEALMVPAADGVLEAYPVSSQVNDVRNEGLHLLDRRPGPPGWSRSDRLRHGPRSEPPPLLAGR
jgi:putative SOS response-associated peptidase YedK